MKTAIPETLKADLPQSKWGKILGVTPVIMTVLATMLAGLASSEMTRAQYDRSLAAQLQSKAGDQWGFFQAKRLRSALQRNTLDLMIAAGGQRPLEAGALLPALGSTPAGAALDTAHGQQVLAVLGGGELPNPPAVAEPHETVRAALAALESSRPDAELADVIAKVDNDVLAQALRAARDHALALDTVLTPINRTIDLIEKKLEAPSTDAALRRDFVAARVGYHARRYDAEARLNQAVASLYELQVRKGNQSAERHHRRSQKFFYGMLAAQMAVIVSSLAIAARQRNLLWSVAAAAGAAAVSFAVYVYLYV